MPYLIFSIFFVINTGLLNLSWAKDSTPEIREAYRQSCNIPSSIRLPDVSINKKGDASGSWRLIETFESNHLQNPTALSEDLASSPGLPANLWYYDYKGTTCYFLYRYNDQQTFNGILCFTGNKICSFDLLKQNPKDSPSISWNDLAIPGDDGFTQNTSTGTNQCSACHIHGFAAPRKKSYDVAERKNWIDKWKTFAVNGGPTWHVPPGKDMPPSGIGKCDIPRTGNCRDCHGATWVKPKEADRYCKTVFNSAFDEKGSMTAIGPDFKKDWELLPIKDCKPFLDCLGGSCKDTKDSLCGVNLQVSKEGSGTGSVTSVPDGIDCGNECDHLFKKGGAVTLKAVAGPNSIFIKWRKTDNSVCEGMTSTCDITSSRMSADYDKPSTYLKTAIAVFDRRPPTTTITIPRSSSTTSTTWPSSTIPSKAMLKVFKEGSGTGRVTSAPNGIDCGNDCAHFFTKDSSVILTAVADSNSIFEKWRKSRNSVCEGTNSTCAITFPDSSTRKAIAVFRRKPTTTTTTTMTIPTPPTTTTTTRPTTTTTTRPTTTTTTRPTPTPK